MKKIQAFIAEDGTLFESEQECLLHERRNAFMNWYKSKLSERAVVDRHANDIGVEYVASWLFNNRVALLQFLNIGDAMLVQAVKK